MWWITVSLILLGIVLMLIEMLLIPGVGIAGFLSLASMGASCWYAFTYCGSTAGIITVAVVVLSLLAMLMVILREKTWKPPESVRIGASQPVNSCNPPNCLIFSSPVRT